MTRAQSKISLAGTLAMLLAILFALSSAASAQEEGAAEVPAQFVRVDPVSLEPLSQSVPVIGRLVATRAGEVAARVAGAVEAFFVEIGDRVAKGDALARLDLKAIEVRRDLAAANLELARAQVDTNREERDLAQQDLARQEGLRQSAAFSQARYDDARQAVNIANTRIRVAEALGSRAAAELRLAKIDLENGVVRAPYEGVVIRRMTEEGAFVSLGDPLVYMIADKNLEIEAAVPFRRLQGITEGGELDFVLDDGTWHRARVRALLPSENPLTRTRVVRLTPTFNGKIARLANAQSVTLHVPLGAERQVLTVHKDAIIQSQGQTVVYVVDGDRAMPRILRIGESLGSRLEVLDGLENGELVVVRGNERLSPGTRVRIAGE